MSELVPDDWDAECLSVGRLCLRLWVYLRVDFEREHGLHGCLSFWGFGYYRVQVSILCLYIKAIGV